MRPTSGGSSGGPAASSSASTTACARFDRALVAVVYLSLIGLLVFGMDATNLPRTL
jgi:hypothetical protein